MKSLSKSLASQITVAIALLTLLALASLAAFTWFAARRADEEALRTQKMLVQREISSIMAAVPREQESFSVWDDGVIHTNKRDVQWVEENFGGWMYRFFKHDRTYIVAPDGELLLSARGEDVVKPPSFGADFRAAERVMTKLRERLQAREAPWQVPGGDIFVVDIDEIEQRPAILSARPIRPHTDAVVVPKGKESIFLAVKFLDGPVVKEIASTTLVKELRYEPARDYVPQPGSIGVGSQQGDVIGYYVWTADRPGLGLIRQIAPWASLVLAFAAGIAFYQARKLRRASAELQESEGRARHLAFHDWLTGLPNRARLESRLDDILADLLPGQAEAAVLLLDLDRFKNVNDTLGHRAGDQVIQQTARRLKDIVGNTGLVARLGGDEFAIVIASRNAVEAASELSDRVLAAFIPPFQLEGDTAHIGVSIGIATAPEAALHREEILRKADIALYEAKKQGRGRYELFSRTMDDTVKQRRQVEADLRKALATGKELELVYQPLYSAEGRITGAEALLRWNHPVHQCVSPLFLVTIAEESGLIAQIGDWVLHEACRMAKRVPVAWIAVNVSPVQLRDADFARRCLDIIRHHRIAPQRIQIEVTEAVVIENPELAGTILGALRSAGVRVALDDFGTGYSSMSYLRNYPLDRLKIDRFFVRALLEGEEGRAIIAAMIEMARALKLKVTAEGVETQEQRDLLVKLGCDEMQGYLFSRPIRAPHFIAKFSSAGGAISPNS
ncbi:MULTISPECIES: putative bifunctional diguanylate cyclase/phosphodiesterase [Chelativorans]|jgi:diguanylate cyclase (GGDEF)-like protein|uniref:Periplasmic sensor diguanylate cyclase/phosphodiesterase n=1 Tax=Chelativorans sp. (strain BNC1) TaxID=266779 RepID=Q11B73_CHESB|nr:MULTISPECIES: bifunctional diguanylate cyclase/phosphodiesterase [Chelativorans]